MAATSSEETREVTWELSKENVQPVRGGRNVNCIAAVLQPSQQDMDRLTEEKQVFEERIIAGENSEDPIEAWDSYLKWTIQNFPSGGNDLTLLNLLRKFIGKFNSEKYRNDIRYVHAWLKLAEIMKDPFETFSFMNTEGIGKECAEFYIAWADEYEKYGDMRRADRIYNDGDDKCAQPIELLQKHHMEFQLRVARGMLNNCSQPPEDEETLNRPQRTALNQLAGKGKHKTIGTQRNGSALRPIQGQGSVWGQASAASSQNSRGFQIYEDAPGGVTVMGETGKWASAPSSTAAKENSSNPGQWKGVKVKQKHVRSQLMPSMPIAPACDFTVYEDDAAASAFQNQPHQIATNIESVLSEKKETKIDFSNIKSAIDEMPVHEGNVTSGYDVDKVYTVMGEMQFEEVRAAHWRKRQKVLAEQAAIMRREQERLEKARLMKEQEEKVEEERRRLYSEKMQLLEQERKCMELERMQMQQKRSDLENRLQQIKILEKSAKTVEEERMLQKEEEDITIQLNAVRRNIRRASMKDCQEIETANASAEKKGEIEIYNEAELQQSCQIEDEMRPHQQTFSAMKPTSANNSLNHSKRSQPSPTVNTKEAMSQINEWFQKPLDDGKYADATSDFGNENLHLHRQEPTYSFKPIHEPAPIPAQQPFFQNENADPFHIFTDEDENASCNRPALNKHGLTARKPVSESENTEDVRPPQESHSQEEDKTGFCFDDVTVAGSHFAAKAHMASTPFCSKTGKLEDMTQLNHLSQIQPEMTENLGLCQRKISQSDPDPSNSMLPCQADVIDGHSQVQSEMLYTLDKEEQAQATDEAKQLSPIMEASNESEKSSVMSSTKTLRAYSESDGSQHPSNNRQLHPEPVRMKSFGSVFSQTPTSQSPAAETKKDDIFCFDDFLSNGSIDCNLWDDMRDTTTHKERPNEDNYNKTDNLARSTDVLSVSGPRTLTNNVMRETGIDEICSNFDTASILDQNEDLIPSFEPHSKLPNTIPDPRDRDLLNCILKKRGLLVGNSKVTVHHKDSEVPKLKKGAQFKLDGKVFKIGQVIGEGAYAKVFDVTIDEDQSNLVVKAQFPPCPWEVYIISHAKHRLLNIGMNDIANSIVDVDSAYLFQDASLLFMPHMRKGTLLDLINAKKGVEKMKDVIAMWLAYQVMNIVHGLHTVGLIHGDVKPDNFMIVPGDSDDFCESCLRVGGIKLIDFGQAIDMTELPHGATFMRCCPTSAFTCIQMQNKEPWNYHTDFYGIAGTLHVVLFGSCMNVRQGKDGKWEITNKIKRWHDDTLWRNFFSTLLNFPTPTEQRPITLADSPLPQLIEEIRSSLEQSDAQMDSIADFLWRS